MAEPERLFDSRAEIAPPPIVVLAKEDLDAVKLAVLARAGEYDLTSNDDGVDRMLRLFSLLSVFSGNVTIENFRPVDAERQPS
jgi:hypothetical protein